MSRTDLGDRVRDKISGLEGLCTARVVYIDNPPGIRITPHVADDGKPVADRWVPESRIEVIAKAELPDAPPE